MTDSLPLIAYFEHSANPDGWIPEQKVLVAEALAAYTAGNAYGFFREARLGRLAPGYLADVVVLDRDLLAIPPVEIEHASVRVTIAGGRVVYRAAP